MTLRVKLLLAQAPIFSALILLAILQVWSVSAVGGAAQNILRENYRSVLAAQRMAESLERIDSSVLFRLAGQGDKGQLQLAMHRKRFESELQIAEGNITEPGEREATASLRRHWQAYEQVVQGLFALTSPDAQRRLYFAQIEPAFRSVKAACDDILAMNQDAMVRKSEHTHRVARRVSHLATLSALAALVLGIVTSLVLTARLLQPLLGLRDAARRLGSGNLDARAEVRGHDEISHLASDFNAMAEQLKRYRASSLGELLLAQQSAQSAIDSLPDPVVIFDAAGVVLNLNRESEALLHIRHKQESSDPLGEVEPVVRDVLFRLRAHVLTGHGPYVPKDFSEAVSVGRGEIQRYLLPRATPVYGTAGSIEGATILLQDITRLRRLDELKNNLVATVAHELRTPLTSLRMAVHLCLEGIAGPVTDKQIELLHVAREDCERLQGIVEDLLDLACIASGRVEMRKVPVSVQHLVECAVAEQQAVAHSKGVQLCAEISARAPQQLCVDPARLALVFSNLISNAVRHTPEGGSVTVRVSAGEDLARFDVIDTGPGIAIEYQRDIFLRFFRVPGSPQGGAGLGLSIAKEIVEAHGGRIGVESAQERGSTFYFQLPL